MRIRLVSSPVLLLFAALALALVVGSPGSRGATQYHALPISGAEYVFAAP